MKGSRSRSEGAECTGMESRKHVPHTFPCMTAQASTRTWDELKHLRHVACHILMIYLFRLLLVIFYPFRSLHYSIVLCIVYFILYIVSHNVHRTVTPLYLYGYISLSADDLVVLILTSFDEDQEGVTGYTQHYFIVAFCWVSQVAELVTPFKELLVFYLYIWYYNYNNKSGNGYCDMFVRASAICTTAIVLILVIL